MRILDSYVSQLNGIAQEYQQLNNRTQAASVWVQPATAAYQWTQTSTSSSNINVAFYANTSSTSSTWRAVNSMVEYQFPWQHQVTNSGSEQWYVIHDRVEQSRRQKRAAAAEAARRRHEEERQREERERVYREQRRLAEAAHERAKALFLAHCTPEQREQWERTGRMIVHSNKGRTFEIRNRGIAGNIALIREGVAVTRYCCHTYDRVPEHDCFLAQKLALETDEDAFLAVANASRV